MIMDVLVLDIKEQAPWSMFFADDINLVSETNVDLQKNLEQWRRVLEDYGMKINRTKTEYLRFDGTVEQELQKIIIIIIGYTERNKWNKISRVVCSSRISMKWKSEVYKKCG